MMSEYEYEIRLNQRRITGTPGPSELIFAPGSRRMRRSQVESLLSLHDAPVGKEADRLRELLTKAYVEYMPASCSR